MLVSSARRRCSGIRFARPALVLRNPVLACAPQRIRPAGVSGSPAVRPHRARPPYRSSSSFGHLHLLGRQKRHVALPGRPVINARPVPEGHRVRDHTPVETLAGSIETNGLGNRRIPAILTRNVLKSPLGQVKAAQGNVLNPTLFVLKCAPSGEPEMR